MTPPSSHSSHVPPCENTPLGVSFGTPSIQQQDKKKFPHFSFHQVVVVFTLVCLGSTAYTRLSPSVPSSSDLNLSLLKATDQNVYENDSNVVPSVSLFGSELNMDMDSTIGTQSQTDASAKLDNVGNDGNDVVMTKNVGTASLIESPPVFDPKWPTDVYDSKKAQDAMYLNNIRTRCYQKLERTDPAQVMACHIYFKPVVVGQIPMALGTIKTGADILEISSTGKIDAHDISVLFEDNALAEMIHRGCFEWNTGSHFYKQDTIQYNSEEDYSRELSRTTSIDVSGSIGYGPVSANAGYKTSSTDTNTEGGTHKLAIGRHRYNELVGSLTNTCLRNVKLFDTVKNLVKPEWSDRWNKIRAATSVTAVKSLGDDYTKVVNGGFYIPVKYDYGVWVNNEMESSYDASSSSESKDASHAISAGLKVELAGVKAGVQTTVTNAVKKNDSQNQSDRKVKVTAERGGANIDTRCMEGERGDDCNSHMDQLVAEVRRDLNTLETFPTSVNDFLTLNDLVKAYFDDDVGLGDTFLQAVNSDKEETPNGFMFGNRGTNDCPVGSVHVLDRTQCRLAFDELSHLYQDTTFTNHVADSHPEWTYAQWPSGCHVSTNQKHNGVYFQDQANNEHGIHGTSAGGLPICTVKKYILGRFGTNDCPTNSHEHTYHVNTPEQCLEAYNQLKSINAKFGQMDLWGGIYKEHAKITEKSLYHIKPSGCFLNRESPIVASLNSKHMSLNDGSIQFNTYIGNLDPYDTGNNQPICINPGGK